MTRHLARWFLVFAGILACHPVAHAVAFVVNSAPAGAMVTIEGQTLPAPAKFDLKRRDEPYAVIVQKPGFQTETVSYSTKQRLKEITVSLEPLTLERAVTIKSNFEGATVTIDLPAQTVTGPDGSIYRFDIDPAAKERLVKGLDDVGLVLQHIERIEAFELSYMNEQPWASVPAGA